MRKIIVVFSLFLLIGCSGFRYQIIEDQNEYLLMGEHYNNNPFIVVKAYIPNSYLIQKRNRNVATIDDIVPIEKEQIIGGYIVDNKDEVEIRLIVYDPYQTKIVLAHENGTYKINNRKQVGNLKQYLDKNEKYLRQYLNP